MTSSSTGTASAIDDEIGCRIIRHRAALLIWPRRAADVSAISHLDRCTGYGKGKRRARTFVGAGPELAVVSLQDGLAHRQADAHAVGFGRVERLENLGEIVCGDANPRVSDGEQGD